MERLCESLRSTGGEARGLLEDMEACTSTEVLAADTEIILAIGTKIVLTGELNGHVLTFVTPGYATGHARLGA